MVLRNPVGLAEAFVDLGGLEIRDGWANLCTDAVHVHLQVTRIAGVRFRDGDTCDCSGDAPALWFAARDGAPLLLLVLDQTRGPDRIEQREAFDALRTSYGAMLGLVSSQQVPSRTEMS